MDDSYEEIIDGETFIRSTPGERHEAICARLHELIRACLANFPGTMLLEVRSVVEFNTGTLLRPDIALITAATRKPWLVGEVISSHDHKMDTVIKKTIYEELNLPRLWMIDPRYDNVEVYHGSRYGLALQTILAGDEILQEKVLPGFETTVRDLFKP